MQHCNLVTVLRAISIWAQMQWSILCYQRLCRQIRLLTCQHCIFDLSSAAQSSVYAVQLMCLSDAAK